MIEITSPMQNQTLPTGEVIAEGIHGPPDSHDLVKSMGGAGMPPTAPNTQSQATGEDWTLNLGILTPGNYFLTVTKDQSSDSVDFTVSGPIT